MSNISEEKKFELAKFVTRNVGGVTALGLAGLSRFVFSGYINVLLKSSYSRSVAEHGLESMGFTMIFLSAHQLLEAAAKNNKDSIEGDVVNEVKVFNHVVFVLFLISLVIYEVKQSQQLSRPLQWEQLAGSLAGVGLGWLAVALLNSLFEQLRPKSLGESK